LQTLRGTIASVARRGLRTRPAPFSTALRRCHRTHSIASLAVGTLEIHLATGFQNIIFDHAPEELVQKANDYCLTELRHEWKEGKTQEQFLYSTRKKAFGALKESWWKLESAAKERVGQALQEQFEFLFDKLNVRDTRQVVHDVTSVPRRRRTRPQEAADEGELEIASDLAD
jgi:hypothetical protein